MYALTRLIPTLLFASILALVLAIPAEASRSTIDPELEKQEAEVERLLKVAEAEFWSLKSRIERERNDRQLRLTQAKADYEKAQASRTITKTKTNDVATSRADRALEKYQTELERAMTGLDQAREELDRVEARVSQYRATLEALRRRTRNSQQGPDTTSPPTAPDSSSSRTPITAESMAASEMRT